MVVDTKKKSRGKPTGIWVYFLVSIPLMWTVSGLYFSWTDIDEIHEDEFLNER
jgi:hypothetical protein